MKPKKNSGAAAVASRTIAMLCAIAWCPFVAAQGEREVTQADVERAAQSQPNITQKDIDRAIRVHRMPTERELAGAGIATPNIDALPQAVTGSKVDLADIAKGFDQLPTKPPSQFTDRPNLLVFVSFSMPEPALKRLVEQASRTDATLLLRGLDGNSLKKTVGRIKTLIGKRKVSFQIDPQAFDRFAVATVPTFALIKPGALPVPCASGTCIPPANYVSASGDVSVDYALEYFQRTAPTFSREATAILAKLRGKP